MLVRRLAPWRANAGKRLVRSPKVYVRDSGLVHALLGLSTLEDVLGHAVSGGSWEGLAIESLLAAAPEGVGASFYRTAAGAEIDLVLTLPGGEVWAIEIKRGSAPKLTRGFHQACADLAPARRFVVYNGVERLAVVRPSCRASNTTLSSGSYWRPHARTRRLRIAPGGLRSRRAGR